MLRKLRTQLPELISPRVEMGITRGPMKDMQITVEDRKPERVSLGCFLTNEATYLIASQPDPGLLSTRLKPDTCQPVLLTRTGGTGQGAEHSRPLS